MKKLKMLIITLIMMLPIYVFAEDGVSLNKSSLSIEEGKTATFTIVATNCAGKVTISSSDTSIATVDKTAEWVENNSTIVTVTAVKSGTATINVELTDVATFNEEELTGTKKVNITVSETSAEPSSNNNLSDLKVDGVTVSGFSSSKTSYTVSTDKTSVDVSATAADSKATVTGTGTKTLNYGDNKVNIKVTAENGSSKTYVLTINKSDGRDGNTYLKELSLEEANISFNKDKYNYDIEVDNSIDTVNIVAKAESDKSTVEGTGEKVLNVGSNVFNIKVTAENGTSKTYVLSIVRAMEAPVGNKATLNYNSNGGSACSPSSKSVEVGSAWGTLCTPTRSGYKFNGWFTSTVGGSKITDTSIATANLIIYAQWKLVQTQPDNPKTGISTPIIALLIIALISIVAFIVVKRRNKNLDF